MEKLENIQNLLLRKQGERLVNQIEEKQQQLKEMAIKVGELNLELQNSMDKQLLYEHEINQLIANLEKKDKHLIQELEDKKLIYQRIVNLQKENEKLQKQYKKYEEPKFQLPFLTSNNSDNKQQEQHQYQQQNQAIEDQPVVNQQSSTQPQNENDEEILQKIRENFLVDNQNFA